MGRRVALEIVDIIPVMLKSCDHSGWWLCCICVPVKDWPCHFCRGEGMEEAVQSCATSPSSSHRDQ